MSISSKELKIVTIRPGQWAGALSKVVAENGYPVTFYLKDPEAVERFKRTGELDRLPGVRMPGNVTASSNLDEVLDGATRVILGSDSVHYRGLVQEVAPRLDPRTEILSVTKGLESGTGLRMSQVLGEVDDALRLRSAFLSGPNLAREVVRRVETGTVIASYDPDLIVANHFKKILANPRLKVITNPDVVGVELGGTLKNPYSIAAGMEAYFAGRRGVSGNRHALLLTASLAEMMRIGVALGADPMTFIGLSGLGDLELGFSGKTRNFELGKKIASRRTREQILREGILYEGLNTLPPLHDLVIKLGIEAPILKALYKVVFEGMKIQEGVRQFMDMDVEDRYRGRGLGFDFGRFGARLRQFANSLTPR